MIVGIAAGMAALIVVSIVIALLAQRAIDAERRCADARVDASTKAGTIAVLTADLKTSRAEVADEKARADALDDVLDEVAADGDAAGARGRVLQRWTRQAAAGGANPDAPGGDGTGAVSVQAPAGGTILADDRDALVRPDDV